MSLPRHFQSQATSLVPDSQRPIAILQLSRSTSSVAVDPLMSIRACFPGCLGLGTVFFGPLLCDGTRGNKFRPIAPYATDWWFEMMSCAVRPPPPAWVRTARLVLSSVLKRLNASSRDPKEDDWAEWETAAARRSSASLATASRFHCSREPSFAVPPLALRWEA